MSTALRAEVEVGGSRFWAVLWVLTAQRDHRAVILLYKYLQKKRSNSLLGKRLILCQVMHSELAAFLTQKNRNTKTTVCYFENVNSIFIAH